MQRRDFIRQSAATAIASLYPWQVYAGYTGEKYPELNKHKIAKIEKVRFEYRWPRHVGKNARKDNHGEHHRGLAFRIYTDQGATGWALGSGRAKDHELAQIKGKAVVELISPEKGIEQEVSPHLDLALHDLMGNILNKPVHQLIGEEGTASNPVYSGMIYFDELEPKDNPAGIDKVLENCQWDIEYGYRQLKVKT